MHDRWSLKKLEKIKEKARILMQIFPQNVSSKNLLITNEYKTKYANLIRFGMII